MPHFSRFSRSGPAHGRHRRLFGSRQPPIELRLRSVHTCEAVAVFLPDVFWGVLKQSALRRVALPEKAATRLKTGDGAQQGRRILA